MRKLALFIVITGIVFAATLIPPVYAGVMEAARYVDVLAYSLGLPSVIKAAWAGIVLLTSALAYLLIS